MSEWMIGRIEEQDFTGSVHRYRVRLADGQLSDWLPKLNHFADGSVTDKPLVINTQVVVLLARDREEGVILGTINCDAHPDPADRDTLHHTRYADGTVVEYDMDSHTLTVDCVGSVVVKGADVLRVEFGGQIDISAPKTTISTTQTHNGDITLNGNLIINGNASVSGMTTTGGLTSTGTAGGGGATITGGVKVTGDVVADGISLKHHTHPGDSGGTTGAPQ